MDGIPFGPADRSPIAALRCGNANGNSVIRPLVLEFKLPHPPAGHLLPPEVREKADRIAFSRLPLQMGEGGRRADEGFFC
jgi:hypothetical protein